MFTKEAFDWYLSAIHTERLIEDWNAEFPQVRKILNKVTKFPDFSNTIQENGIVFWLNFDQVNFSFGTFIFTSNAYKNV